AKAYNVYPVLSVSFAGFLCATSDGGFIFHGNQSDIDVVKLSSGGSVQWARRIRGANEDCSAQVIQTSDGGYVVVGHTASWGSGPSDCIVIKMASDGTVQWARVYGGPSYEYGKSVAELANGDLVVVGYTGTFNPNDDILVLRISGTDGSLIWGRAFDAGGNERASYVVPTADGCVAIQASGYYLKMDLNGNLIWAKRGALSGGYSAATSANGDIVFFGYASPNNTDFGLLRVGLDGNYPSCLFNWSPTQINAAVNSSPITVGEVITVSSIDVSPETYTPNLVTTNLCAPVDAGETEPDNIVPQVLCSHTTGGLIFLSRTRIWLRLYAPDGRLSYCGELKEGETRIPLGQGVYLWQAGPYKGKAVVR
ncbi:MAG: hypothetical protein ACPL68_03390, partial [Candidatus Hydrothermia bacterium]